MFLKINVLKDSICIRECFLFDHYVLGILSMISKSYLTGQHLYLNHLRALWSINSIWCMLSIVSLSKIEL